MRSIFWIVLRRWAITMAVRPSMSFHRASWINTSLSESRALVASSSTKIGASLIIARAIAIRWRWPPDNLTPRSPTKVSYLLGSWSMNSSAWASLAAFLILLIEAPGLPYDIFSDKERWNSSGSWGTYAILARRLSWVTRSTSWLSIKTAPDWVSINLNSSLVIVVLPPPLGPTRPTFSPDWTIRLRWSNSSSVFSEWVKETSSNLIAPSEMSIFGALGISWTTLFWASISVISEASDKLCSTVLVMLLKPHKFAMVWVIYTWARTNVPIVILLCLTAKIETTNTRNCKTNIISPNRASFLILKIQ